MHAQDAKRDVRSALSREALVPELVAKGVLNLVPPEIKRIHTLLESEFSPLQLCHQLAPLLEQLDGLSKPLSSASPVQVLNPAPLDAFVYSHILGKSVRGCAVCNQCRPQAGPNPCPTTYTYATTPAVVMIVLKISQLLLVPSTLRHAGA